LSVKKSFSLLTIVLPAVAACTSVHSNLTVNGSQFGPDDCQTLQDEEIFGVDLANSDQSGPTLRLAQNVDNSIAVVVIDGIHKPVALTGCSTLRLDRSDNDKYGYYSIDGDAQINCDDDADNIHVHGTTSFNDCEHEL
jgi:hypothetical protein